MKKWYGIVRWSTEDVIAAAKFNEITLTEAQAEKWWKENEQTFETIMPENWNEVLCNMDFVEV